MYEKLAVLVLALSVLLTGCYNEDHAIQALEAQGGFSQIEVGGHAWFACSEDDFYATKFTAINSDGKPVSGAVCSGFVFKNATIRY